MLQNQRLVATPAAGDGYDIEVDSLSPEAWDQIACAFDDLTTDQLACFVDNAAGIVVAAARLIILTLPGLARGLAYCRFGPIWRRKDSMADPATYRAALNALFDEYCLKRGHYLTVIPRPNPEFQAAEVAILNERGFELRRPFEDTNRYLVVPEISDELQLQGFDQKWRYNLKQAMRNGVEVRIGMSHSDIETFCALYASMVDRKGFAAFDPVHLLPKLASQLPDPLRPHIVLAYHDGRPIVGAVVAILGDTAFYIFGASDKTALPLKGGYALQWWITRWLASERVRWYDLGGEALSEGLRQFKKGFVGKSGATVFMQGEYDRWTDVRSRLTAEAIYLVRSARRVYRAIRYNT
jgi:hypothetical protein